MRSRAARATLARARGACEKTHQPSNDIFKFICLHHSVHRYLPQTSGIIPPRILDVVDNFWTLKGKLSQNPTIWPLKGKLSQNQVIQILACLKNIF
jgi:hypothetical protein